MSRELQLPRPHLEGRERGPWRIEHFTVSEQDAFFHQLREAVNGRDRGVLPGTYTSLIHKDRGIVMSDTPAEARDHLIVMDWLDQGATTFLIHGLGLGMIATWLCSDPRTEHVDVVEVDEDVIDLIAPQLDFPNLTIHHGDAFTYEFPSNARWDAAWHDIWDSICSDNLIEMDALESKYRGRVKMQGSWARELCDDMQGEEFELLAMVYRQRGKEVGDECAAHAGLPPLTDF